MDKDPSLDVTERVIEAAKVAAITQTQADIEAAHILAEAHRCEVADIINARADGQLRIAALKVSSNLIYGITLAQLAFSYLGKHLDVPDVVWVFVLAPWVGVGSSKILEGIFKVFPKK